MAAKQTKRGYRYRVLPENDKDTFNDFLNDDSEFNMNKLNDDLEALDDKVLLGNKRQQNFKFIENKTLSSILGAMSNRYYDGGNTDRITISTTELTEFMMAAKFETRSGGDIFWTKDNDNLIVYDSSIGVSLKTNGVYSFKTMNTPKLTNKETELVLQLKNGVFSVFINGRKHGELFGDSIRISTLNIFGNHNFTFKNRGWLDYIIISDKVLTPQEIEASLTIHNNTPSIKELHTTDSTGKTSILNLASSEDFVEMSTGRTLREEYMGVLKTMGKELVSSDGSSVEVNDGVEARVISGEIKGQTVKNYAMSWIDGFTEVYSMNKDSITISGYDGQVVSKGEWIKQLKPSTNYTALVNVIENTCTRENVFMNSESAGSLNAALIKIPPKQTGWLSFDFTTKETFDKWVWTTRALSGEKLVAGNPIIVERDDKNKITSYIPFGLNSTQAIISNNGQQYPIYESTIKGKTRILDGKLVSLKPKVDTLPELGGVPSVSDTIDVVTRVLTINTKIDRSVLVGATWTKSAITNTEANCFQTSAPIDSKKDPNEPNCFTNSFVGVRAGDTLNSSTLKPYTCGIDSAGFLRLGVPKSIDTIQDMENFIKNNPQELIYRIATPTTIQLTEKQLAAYNAHKKLISLGGIGDVYDTLGIKDDGSVGYVRNLNSIVLTPDYAFESYGGFTTPNHSQFKLNISDLTSSNNAYKHLICSHFKSIQNSTQILTLDEEFIVPVSGSTPFIVISISKSKLTTPNVDGFKAWLRNNMVEIQYQLSTPVVTYIPKELVPTILTY